MPNELLWILFLLFELIAAVVLLRAFGRIGLYGLIVMNVILCNIQVQKLILMLGATFTLGNVLYGAIFFATDLIGELYGKREARRAVWLGFAVMVVAMFAMLFAVEFTPVHESGLAGTLSTGEREHSAATQGALENLYGRFGALFSTTDISFPRIVLASLIAYLLSQFHDVWAFHFWKAKTKGRHLWLRNNASTWVSQLIDSAVFCTLAFAGTMGARLFFQVLLTTYLIKVAVAALDTPFVYLGRRLATRSLRATRSLGATKSSLGEKGLPGAERLV